MQTFKDRDDVEEWLDPLSYDEFWTQIEIFALPIPPRAECDDDIRKGRAEQAVVLNVLKAMARSQIIADQALPPRDLVAWMALH